LNAFYVSGDILLYNMALVNHGCTDDFGGTAALGCPAAGSLSIPCTGGGACATHFSLKPLESAYKNEAFSEFLSRAYPARAGRALPRNDKRERAATEEGKKGRKNTA